jgi:hypothetical protein
LAVGLSSGFAEPLEATNIHQTISQIELFVKTFNFKILEFDKLRYNEVNNIFYDRIYDYIRFCYTGNRNDSKFWHYMKNNTPKKIKILEEKIKNSIMNEYNYIKSVFDFINFTVVANGLNKINKKSYMQEIENRFMTERIKEKSNQLKKDKRELNKVSVSHIKYIRDVIKN